MLNALQICQTCRILFNVIGRLLYNQNDIHYILQNIACQQYFDRGLLEQLNLYNMFGFTKRLICK